MVEWNSFDVHSKNNAIKGNSDEVSGENENLIGNQKKGNTYKVAKSMAELGSNVLHKMSNELKFVLTYYELKELLGERWRKLNLKIWKALSVFKQFSFTVANVWYNKEIRFILAYSFRGFYYYLVRLLLSLNWGNIMAGSAWHSKAMHFVARNEIKRKKIRFSFFLKAYPQWPKVSP